VIRLGARGGQAAVETVAMLPLLAAATVALVQVLAAGVTREYAGHAAEAGAVAIVQHRDPVEAARAALPGWSRGRVDVHVDGGRVRVRVEPPALLRGVGRVLATTAEADAGDGAP
jgi:hypothetical protein